MKEQNQDSPTDTVRIVVTDAASGDHYRMSTRTMPDGLIFTRSATESNAHELEMTLAEFNARQEDLGLRPQASESPLRIYFLVNEAAHGGGEVIAALKAELAEAKERHEQGVSSLAKELDEAHGQSAAGPVRGLTSEEMEFLAERDALITLLMPYVEDDENDTPVSVLTRLLARIERAPAPDALPSTSTATGHAPADADLAGPNGEPTGPAVVQGPPGSNEKKPEPVEFDRSAFAATLKGKEVPELRGMAAPAGIKGFGSMNAMQLRKALVEYEVARHAEKPQAPTNTARPDGEQPAE